MLLASIDKLRTYFGAFGSVTDAVVMKDPISRRSRGFGFITYADPACVDRALAQPSHVLDSRRVRYTSFHFAKSKLWLNFPG